MKKKREKVFFISDLHMDRWDRDRKKAFLTFLDFVEQEAAELFVLGDIFDFPALKGESIWPRHSEIINRLRSMPSKGIPLTYLIGNHDISLRGIEIIEEGLTITYSDVKKPHIRHLFGHQVYMEHGHYYDPLFQEHIYDAIDFLKSLTGTAVDVRTVDFLRDVVRIFQRNPKIKDPAAKESTEEKPKIGVPERFLKMWEQAAEQLLKKMKYSVVIFGHTHAPGISHMLVPGQYYVNTGDWVVHSTYIEMTPKGFCLKDWIEKREIECVPFL